MNSYKNSKSNNLISVKKKLSLFVVPNFISINVKKFKEDSNKVLALISSVFDCNLLAVRSSASDEDSVTSSLAGEYESGLNVPFGSSSKIIEAINTVISSYEKKRPILNGDEIIIQEMVQDSSMSGVIFTHDLNTGAPYYVINYDDQSGKTDAVTSGDSEYSNRTIYVHRDSSNKLHSERFTILLQAIKELEELMQSHFLDIEFVLGENLTPYLLQVRAITTKSNWNRPVVKRVNNVLQGLELFISDYEKSGFLVGHNVKFDINILGSELFRIGHSIDISKKDVLDTCSELTANVCKLPGGRRGKYKFPTLVEIYSLLFKEKFSEAHNASADVEATSRVFFELVRKGVFDQSVFKGYPELINNLINDDDTPIQILGLKHLNLKKESEKINKSLSKENKIENKIVKEIPEELKSIPFVHLHNNSQFSVLQSTSRIINLVRKAAEFKMPAIAITDRANMMGCFHFIRAIKNHNSLILNESEGNKIKPIIGCELNVCNNHLDKSYRDDGYQIVFLAKNKNGYQNLSKMCSLGYTDGFYYVPRIDREIVEKHKEDLIVLSGNMYGEIASKILNIGENQADEALLWWKKIFKGDFYLEIMRHGQEDEDRVNTVLKKLAHKHDIQIIPTNNSFYINKEDANAHDILLCVKDGEKQSTPIGRGRGFRYGLPNQEYYFKSPNEMKLLFKDMPNAITNILDVVDKIDEYDLAREVLLPKFSIPKEFKSKSKTKEDIENEYLKHLTYEGVKKCYNKISKELDERILFELNVIKNSGYPGYFLIVQDLIKAARNMGVSVGPGRGSAAGSVVAFCLEITKMR